MPRLNLLSESLTTGLIDDVRRAVQRLGFCATATVMHLRLMKLLRASGFCCRFEVDAFYNGRHGRIDILATRGNDRVGIELDRSTPRAKSILKLKGIPDLTHRVIVLRSPTKTAYPSLQGIDAVLVAGQRTTGERSDACARFPPTSPKRQQSAC